MFGTKNLSIKINNRYLIKDLSLTLNKGDKLAIIGEEGNGKSTLIRKINQLLMNREELKVGYLPKTTKIF